MATLSNVQLTISRDVANADVGVTFTSNWSTFDQLTNLPYQLTWKLIGDDTGQDGDNAPVGDDPIPMGLMFISTISSNGQASSNHNVAKTISWASLDEDNTAGNLDDEIRAVVTLTPQLPVATSRESAAVTVTAP